MALTEGERVRCRHHLGYLNVTAAATFFLGIPAALQTTFMIEPAMDRVIVDAEPKLRQLLDILDSIESQGVCDLELLAINRIGDIEVREDGHKVLFNQEYLRWQRSLANLLGISPNPFDQRFPSRTNASVHHG